MLPAPGFHHLHLNSVDPDSAIDFYTRQFPSTTKGSWGGFPALKSPNDVLVLFTKVDRPPPTEPQSAIWHFGWHVTDARRSLETYKARPEVELLPLYTTDEGGSVLISSDTWPSVGGVLGLTKAQIAEAKAKRSPAGGRRRVRLYEGSRQRPRRICREPPGRALQPRASLPGGSDRRVRLVSTASQRAGAAGLRADGGRTATAAARARPHLAGAQPGGDVPHAAGRRRIRRRVDDVVRQSRRPAARRFARTAAGPHRAQASRISTRGSRSCAARASNSSKSPTRSATRAP